MKELDCQKLIVDAVREHGGMAHKMAHRFLVGVADLLVKLPGYPAAIIEVKLEQLRTGGKTTLITPDVTVLQDKFIKNYYNAGMTAGVASFIEYDRKGIRRLAMKVFSLDPKHESHYNHRGPVLVYDHTPIGSIERFIQVVGLIKRGLYD